MRRSRLVQCYCRHRESTYVTLRFWTRALKTIQVQRIVFFGQKVAYVGLKFEHNQGLWSQNGDTMSPGLGGVFQLMKKGHFRVPVTLSQLPFMGVSCLLAWSHWSLTSTPCFTDVRHNH